MSAWDDYPRNYRAAEVQRIVIAVRAGESVSVVGLSGSGKSNLLGFMAHRLSTADQKYVLVDSNRLPEYTLAAFLREVLRALGGRPAADAEAADELQALDAEVERWLGGGGALCLLLDLSLLDRSDLLGGESGLALFSNLRALRDAHKFRLTFVTASRRPLPPRTEFAELIQGNTIWLGPLAEADARWNVAGYAARKGLRWDGSAVESLIEISRGYPSLLRAACEACAAGAPLSGLGSHPAVRARLAEFWADRPTAEDLRLSGLADHPLLAGGPGPSLESAQLTAKEQLLLDYFVAHPEVVCEKDDLVRAVWPEDRVFERGVRDDSLAQLVRRLRGKIEPDSSAPRHIHTVPGRGYRFTPS